MVVLLHGGGAKSGGGRDPTQTLEQSQLSQFDGIVEADQVMLVALTASSGAREDGGLFFNWYDRSEQCQLQVSGECATDDVGYISQALVTLRSELGATHVAAYGHSSGGNMLYTMHLNALQSGISLPLDTIGITGASISKMAFEQYMPEGTWNGFNESPTIPSTVDRGTAAVPICHAHGTDDTQVAYGGGDEMTPAMVAHTGGFLAIEDGLMPFLAHGGSRGHRIASTGETRGHLGASTGELRGHCVA
eukprot:gene552-946_t